jgi:hypothetical protein
VLTSRGCSHVDLETYLPSGRLFYRVAARLRAVRLRQTIPDYIPLSAFGLVIGGSARSRMREGWCLHESGIGSSNSIRLVLKTCTKEMWRSERNLCCCATRGTDETAVLGPVFLHISPYRSRQPINISGLMSVQKCILAELVTISVADLALHDPPHTQAFGVILRERRRYFRCPLSIPVSIRRRTMPLVRCDTVNISEGGMAVSTSVPFSAGEDVRVQFTLTGSSGRARASKAVVFV